MQVIQETLAEKGHEEAQYILGKCYQNGILVNEGRIDMIQAEEWLKKSADKKFPPAMYEIHLNKEAAELGYPPAQYRIAYEYYYGMQVNHVTNWLLNGVSKRLHQNMKRHNI